MRKPCIPIRVNGVAAVPVTDADQQATGDPSPVPAENRPSPFLIFCELCALSSGGRRYPTDFLAHVYQEQQEHNSGFYRLSVDLCDLINRKKPPSSV